MATVFGKYVEYLWKRGSLSKVCLLRMTTIKASLSFAHIPWLSCVTHRSFGDFNANHRPIDVMAGKLWMSRAYPMRNEGACQLAVALYMVRVVRKIGP